MDENFKQYIISKDVNICVIGLGYVGLPLAKSFLDVGFPRVVGYDVDVSKVVTLKNGFSYDKKIMSDTFIQDMLMKGFTPTSNEEIIDDSDVILICVPTPLGNHQEPNLDYVESACSLISRRFWETDKKLIVLESTIYPGATRDFVLPILQKNGYSLHKDFYLAYSPERESPGDGIATRSIPKVVGGINEESLEAANLFYSQTFTTVPVSSTECAEACKLLENIYRGVNIALVNELKMIFDKMNLNIWDVIKAASTKPFGFQPFYPGPGLGGHCIPVDPFYLTWKAKELGISSKFIELSGQINRKMPNYVVEKIMLGLNDRYRAIKGSNILLLGLAYKPNIGDIRESPSIEIIKLLSELGAEVYWADSYVSSDDLDSDIQEREIVGISVSDYDCVVILTDHDHFKKHWDKFQKEAKLIVDTRGVYSRKGDVLHNNVVYA